MSDSHRTDGSRALESASDADRDAKIEQLLLAGLDHYFAARYEQAINVWTRALFLDRSHPRARAYIDRARSALAEQQRETEELLHAGVSAVDRGETAEAKRLLRAAIDSGGPADEARALLERLTHQRAEDGGTTPGDAVRVPVEASPATLATSNTATGLGSRAGFRLLVVVVALAALGAAAQRVGLTDGLGSFLDSKGDSRGVVVPPPISRDATLPLPRRGEMTLSRARSLAAGGRLREALTLLDGVWSADPQKPEVDRLRADIQRRLIALVARPSQPASVSDAGHDAGKDPSRQP